MIWRFSRHYTLSEARALLPRVREWLEQLAHCRNELHRHEKKLKALAGSGKDLGGETVNKWVKTLAAIREALYEFYSREIQIKDLDRGLIDFPAIIDEKEVFLCWEKKEADIEFWHELDAGYAGRERIQTDEL